MSENLRCAIEALLFASEKPLTIEQLRKVLDDLGADQIRQELEGLKTDYLTQSRGIRLVEVAGGYQLVTAAQCAPFLKKLFKNRYTEKLSKPALETLAIIAYKQPLTRLEIEILRKVNVDGVMKSLYDKNLIRICGRKKVPGRPFVYGTSRQFMEYFGLKSLDDLPKFENFPAAAEEKLNEDIEPINEENVALEENHEAQKIT